MTIRFVTDEKVADTSSKGNQEKWQDNGRWYKLDQFGYEGLAETVISRLLEYSNIETDTAFHFVRYRMEGGIATAAPAQIFCSRGSPSSHCPICIKGRAVP